MNDHSEETKGEGLAIPRNPKSVISKLIVSELIDKFLIQTYD